MLKIRTILFPTDYSDTSKQALAHALFLAEQFDAEIHLLHAVVLHGEDPHEPEHHFPEAAEILKKLFELSSSEMARLLEPHKKRPLKLREVTKRGLYAAPVILDYAEDCEADLIVMGTHGRRGARRMLLGSVAEEVVRLAPCPVLTLREQEEPRPVEAFERLLVPVDFSEPSKTALVTAKELARTYDAELQVVHVIEEQPYPAFYGTLGAFPVAESLLELEKKSASALNDLMAETAGPDVPYETQILTGRASAEIVRFAEEQRSDMIVIATHGLYGLKRLLLGSTAEEVTRSAACPVFTVKAFGKTLL